MIDTLNMVKVYEVDGSEVNYLDKDVPKLKVTNHWNRSSFVCIHVDGKQYTVLAKDLNAAIMNAQNAHPSC